MTGARQRIDKWLCFARMVKTRTLAAAIVSQGQLRLNKARVSKPSHEVARTPISVMPARFRSRNRRKSP